MPLTRAQLLSGNSSQGNVLSGQVQGITQGQGVSISPNGTISVNPLTVVGLMRMGQTKESARDAYNSYEWPTEPPTDTKQTISVSQISSGLTYLEWVDSNQITWTQKGQLAVGTGPGSFTLLPAPITAGQILSTDPTTTEGLTYTANYVATTGSTGSALIPAGSTAQQPDPATTVGSIRYNTSIASLEYSSGTAWIPVASDPEVEDRIQFANATTPGLQVSVSAPVPNSNTGTTLSIGVDSATITEPGIVQLTNDYTGTSQTLGFTQYGASLLNAKINSITGGNVLAGTYDSATGTVLTTTTAGASAGFVVGSQAPAATTALDNYYLLVTVAGNQGPPGAPIPGTGVQSGDWFIVQDDGAGATWQTIDFQNFAPTASQVSLAAVPGLTATNVQQGIQQLTSRTDATITAVTSTTPGITVATTSASPFGNQAAITLNPPTATAIGGVKAGTNITIASDGTISATGGGTSGVSSISGVNGITVSPNTGSVVVNGSALLQLAGGTMTGPLITASGSSSAPALGIGSNSRGFYQASSGTAYTTGGGSAGTTLIISSNGQLLLGRASTAASKNYGGGFIQMFGDGTAPGGASAVFAQFGGGEQAALTLMTGSGSISSPSVLTSGFLGYLLFSDPTSSSNFAPAPRASVSAYKTGNSNATELLMSVSGSSSPTPVATWQFQAGAFRPYVDNNQVLGTTTYRPQYLCAVSGVINTSDPSKKKNVAPIEAGYGLDYVKSLNPVSYQWITEYNDVSPDPNYPNDPTKVVVTPVPGDVTHFGFLANEVSSSLTGAGSVLASKNGLVGKHKHLPPPVRVGADAANLEEYWMNHSQLIPCLVKSIQQLSDSLDALQAEFDAYKAAHP